MHLVAVVATIAAVGSPGTGFSQDGTDTVGSARLTAEETSTYFQPSIASSNATYKYRLLRYSHLNFGNRQKFEHWLDALGAKGFESALHFPNDFFNPRDDTRLFISRVGGSPRRVLDYEIAVHRISLELV